MEDKQKTLKQDDGKNKEIEKIVVKHRLTRTPPKPREIGTPDPNWLGQLREAHMKRINTSGGKSCIGDEEEDEYATVSSDEQPEEKQSIKRRRRASPPTQKTKESLTSTGLENALAKIGEQVKILENLIKENSNTKKEIKASVRELSSWNKRVAGALKEERGQPSHVSQMPPRLQKDMGTQVEEADILSELERKKTEDLEALLECLEEETDDFESIANILDRNWPAEVFKKTDLVLEENIEYKGQEAFAMIIDSKRGKRKGLMSIVENQAPSIAHIMNNTKEVERVSLENRVKTKDSEERSEKHFFIIPFDIGTTEVNDMQDLYEKILQFRKELIEYPEKGITLLTDEGININYLRKILEYALREVEIKVTIGTPSNEVEKKAPPKTEKILIKPGQNTYADLLKNIKASVDIQKMGVGVKNIRKSHAGNIVLEVERDKAEDLRKEIKEKIKEIGDSDIAITRKERHIFLTGIDEVTSKEEVKEAILNATKANDTDLRIIFMKNNIRGEQTCMIAANKWLTNRLQKTGSIRIGWINVKVREKITPLRCYRCLGFGHGARDCEGEDRSKLCRNCGEEGHKMNSCQNASFCHSCQKTGHRMDQTKCPLFRNLVKEGSNNRNKKANNQTQNVK